MKKYLHFWSSMVIQPNRTFLGVNVVADAAGAFADEPEVYSKEWNINGEHVLLGGKKEETR